MADPSQAARSLACGMLRGVAWLRSITEMSRVFKCTQ